MTRTSSISGAFVIRQRSPVRVAAASIFSAAFFAPLMATVPDSGRPPSTRKTSRGTASGTYSQWNGLASAISVVEGSRGRGPGLSAVARTFPVTPLRDTDAQQCLLERGASRGQVGALVIPGLERALRLATRLLGLLEIDLAGHVGGLRHHDDAIRADLQEAADDRERLLAAALADAQLPDAEHRHERSVVRQHPELALGAWQLDR